MKAEPASPDQRVPSQSNTAMRGFRAWTRVWKSAVVRRVDKRRSGMMSVPSVDKTTAEGAKARRGIEAVRQKKRSFGRLSGSSFRKQEKV
jgi:hypothetical protein